jgi:hypothetical protein
MTNHVYVKLIPPTPHPCACLQVSYKEPTPPDTELVVRSHVVAVRENQNPGLGKAAVEVDVAILLPQADGSEKLLVQVGGCSGALQGGGGVRVCHREWVAQQQQQPSKVQQPRHSHSHGRSSCNCSSSLSPGRRQ